MPEAGKFNGGQKLLFWLLVACMVLLILSGIVIWRAYFSFLFPVVVVRFAAVVHAAAAAVMIALIIVHIYAAIWTKESIGAMLYGTGQAGLGEAASPGMVPGDDRRGQMNTEARIIEPGQIEAPAGEIRFLFLPGRDLFGRRAERFRLLSEGHPLGDYLAFLALLADAQQKALNRFPALPLPDPKEQALCREHGMPLLAARSWPRDPAWRWQSDHDSAADGRGCSSGSCTRDRSRPDAGE